MTNKNKIAIAPIYTIKKRIGKNSIPKSKSNIDKLKKAKTKDKTECIGFIELITIHPDIIPPIAKIKKSICSILMSEGIWTPILSIRSRKLFLLSYRHIIGYKAYCIDVNKFIQAGLIKSNNKFGNSPNNNVKNTNIKATPNSYSFKSRVCFK